MNRASILIMLLLVGTIIIDQTEGMIHRVQGRKWKDMDNAVDYYKGKISQFLDELNKRRPAARKTCHWRTGRPLCWAVSMPSISKQVTSTSKVPFIFY